MDMKRPAAIFAVIAVILVAGCDDIGDWVDGECDDGDLDRPRFCDRSGDLVADIDPDDPEQWVDPETLIFAYTPVEDPAQYREVWDDFIDHLEETTGRDVQFFAAQSNAAQIEAMRSGRLHIAGFSTGAVPLAVNCAGFVPTAMMADGTDGDYDYGYEMEIITHVDSGIESISDLTPDHSFAFTSQTSNSGYKVPTVLLEEEYGMIADRDFEAEYSGGHDNSLLGVDRQDYDVAAVANEVTNRIMERDEVDDVDGEDEPDVEPSGCGARIFPSLVDDNDDSQVDADDIRVLYTSDTFPTTAFGPVYNLHPELVDKIEEAFFEFPWEDTTIADEFSDSDRFIPVDYRRDWADVRQADTAFDDGYSCR